jgi:hypothetical protein
MPRASACWIVAVTSSASTPAAARKVVGKRIKRAFFRSSTTGVMRCRALIGEISSASPASPALAQ